MTATQQELMKRDLLAELEKSRAKLGSVNPQFSYNQRLVNAALVDDALLVDLHFAVTREGEIR